MTREKEPERLEKIIETLIHKSMNTPVNERRYIDNLLNKYSRRYKAITGRNYKR